MERVAQYEALAKKVKRKYFFMTRRIFVVVEVNLISFIHAHSLGRLLWRKGHSKNDRNSSTPIFLWDERPIKNIVLLKQKQQEQQLLIRNMTFYSEIMKINFMLSQARYRVRSRDPFDFSLVREENDKKSLSRITRNLCAPIISRQQEKEKKSQEQI